GFYRAEILAALVNSILLIVVAAWILYAAWQRLNESSDFLPRVEAVPMLVVASGGLVVTLVAVALLHSGAQHSLNVRGAVLEMLAALLTAVDSSVGARII